MNQGPAYLTITDLQKLMGTRSYRYAAKVHQRIREGIKPGKKNLTIREYCDWTGDPYEEIRRFLRIPNP